MMNELLRPALSRQIIPLVSRCKHLAKSVSRQSLLVRKTREQPSAHEGQKQSILQPGDVYNTSTKRILILMSDTGGGHRASAEALRSAFAERFDSQFRIDIVDLWIEHTPWPLNRIPKSYRFLANDAPWLWKFIYEIGEKPEATKPMMDAAYGWAKRPISRLIYDTNPDLVVAVHPILQEVPMRILARVKPQVPFVTVVTDLATIHAMWFQQNVTLCFVPSAEAYRCALQSGMRPEQLRQCGLPIRPVFAQEPRSKEVLRQELGMQSTAPAVLLVGGGEGFGPVAEIARAVAAQLAADRRLRRGPGGQLVVVCGRNQKLRDELMGYAWPIPTIINGFVNNMADWMAACDCIITKAGPGTIAEALARGLPIVLSGFIVGQEEGNVPYVVNNDVGLYAEDPQEIAGIVSRWFGPERVALAGMALKARQLGSPHAAFQIVEEIAKLLI
jgi:1,2-diacylglycerol 3-beta-galactosyltransferase